MRHSELVSLYDYNAWGNQRVLVAAALVSDLEYLAPAPLSHGSLRGALVHTLAVEWLYRLRCQEGLSPTALLVEGEFPSVAALAERWSAEETHMRRYLATLRDQDLDRVVHYKTTSGVSHQNSLWQMLVHMVLHGTQTRAEAAVLLTQYGHSPGDLDLILFLRQPA